MRQSAAGAHVTHGEVGLGDRTRGALIAQETAQIGQRRTGDRELPIQNRGHAPSSAGGAQQQVSFVKVAVHERSFGIESG